MVRSSPVAPGAVDPQGLPPVSPGMGEGVILPVCTVITQQRGMGAPSPPKIAEGQGENGLPGDFVICKGSPCLTTQIIYFTCMCVLVSRSVVSSSL